MVSSRSRAIRQPSNRFLSPEVHNKARSRTFSGLQACPVLVPVDARQEICSASAKQRVAELVPGQPFRRRRPSSSSALSAPVGGAQALRRCSLDPPKAWSGNVHMHKIGVV